MPYQHRILSSIVIASHVYTRVPYHVQAHRRTHKVRSGIASRASDARVAKSAILIAGTWRGIHASETIIAIERAIRVFHTCGAGVIAGEAWLGIGGREATNIEVRQSIRTLDHDLLLAVIRSGVGLLPSTGGSGLCRQV